MCIAAASSPNLILTDNYGYFFKGIVVCQAFFKSYSLLYYEQNTPNALLDIFDFCGVLAASLSIQNNN